jgi:hypothetical protein
VAHGYHAASLAHLANVSYRLGKQLSTAEIQERLANDKAGQETLADFVANLEANKLDLSVEKITAGQWLEFDPAAEKFTGEFAAEANKMAQDEYATGFELPKIG